MSIIDFYSLIILHILLSKCALGSSHMFFYHSVNKKMSYNNDQKEINACEEQQICLSRMLSHRFRISSYIVNIFLGLYNIEFVEKFLLSLISIRRMVHEYRFLLLLLYASVPLLQDDTLEFLKHSLSL